jgi:hypothetical protein
MLQLNLLILFLLSFYGNISSKGTIEQKRIFEFFTQTEAPINGTVSINDKVTNVTSIYLDFDDFGTYSKLLNYKNSKFW